MKGSIAVALSQQKAIRRQMEVAADNLANAMTAGFQKEMMRLKPERHPKSTAHPLSLVKMVRVERDLSPGALQSTGNPLDFALHEGRGYFKIETPDGSRYTRNGQFKLNEQSQIVNGAGHLVSGEGGAIQIPVGTHNITVDKDGNIYADSNRISRFSVTHFEDEQALIRMGDNLFEAGPTAQEKDSTETKVLQKTINMSNVNTVTEMVHMLDLSRQYEANQRLIDAEDERRRGAISGIIREA